MRARSDNLKFQWLLPKILLFLLRSNWFSSIRICVLTFACFPIWPGREKYKWVINDICKEFEIISIFFGKCCHWSPKELRSEIFFCNVPLSSNVDRGPKGISQDSSYGYFGLITARDAQGMKMYVLLIFGQLNFEP